MVIMLTPICFVSQNFYGEESAPPDTIFPLQQIMPMADRKAKVVMKWNDIRSAVNADRVNLALKRYGEILEMAHTGKVAPGARK